MEMIDIVNCDISFDYSAFSHISEGVDYLPLFFFYLFYKVVSRYRISPSDTSDVISNRAYIIYRMSWNIRLTSITM